MSKSKPENPVKWATGYKKISSVRVLRGGSWFNTASSARVSVRYWYSPVNRSDSLGFRLARTKK